MLTYSIECLEIHQRSESAHNVKEIYGKIIPAYKIWQVFAIWSQALYILKNEHKWQIMRYEHTWRLKIILKVNSMVVFALTDQDQSWKFASHLYRNFLTQWLGVLQCYIEN